MRDRRGLRGLWLAGAALAALTLAGCERQPTAAPSASVPAPAKPTDEDVRRAAEFVRDQAPAPAPAPAAAPALPSADARGGAAPAALRIKFTAPPEWQQRAPQSSMRLAEYALPRSAGDDSDGVLALFFNLGPPQMNIERWKAQFSAPDGSALPESAISQEQFSVGEFRVTLVDIQGRYTPSPMGFGGGPPPAPRDNQRVLAAVVEATEGPYYFKAEGPAATMAAQRTAFVDMLKSLQR